MESPVEGWKWQKEPKVKAGDKPHGFWFVTTGDRMHQVQVRLMLGGPGRGLYRLARRHRIDTFNGAAHEMWVNAKPVHYYPAPEAAMAAAVLLGWV